MHAGRHQAARHRRARASRIGHRGGEGAALHAADGQSPPRKARGRDGRAAAATGRARGPAHPRRAAAGLAGGRDHRAHRRRRRRTVRACRPERRAGARGQLLVRDRLAHPAGGGSADRQASRPADRPDEHAATRGLGAAAHRQDRPRGHLPLRRHRTRAGERPPAPPARRSALPAVHPPLHARHSARRHLDRRLRPVPHPPAVDVCRGRVRTQDRIHHRGHGRDAGAGRRRPGRDDQPRVGPACPPRQRHRGERTTRIAPTHLCSDLRGTTRPARHHRAPGSTRRSRGSGLTGDRRPPSPRRPGAARRGRRGFGRRPPRGCA